MPVLFEWLVRAVEQRLSSANAGQALIYHDTYLSYRGLLHRVERRARELASIGIRKGEWVGLMLGNDPEFIVLALALSKSEVTVVPLDPTMGSRDLDMTMDVVPLRALITRPNAMDPLAAPSGTLRMAGPAQPPKMIPESRHRLTGTLLSCALYPFTPPPVPKSFHPELALLTLDSGGDPKAVLRSKAELEGIAFSLGQTLGLNQSSRILCTAPLHDSQGWDFGLVASLAHGATLFLDDNVGGARIAKLLLDHAIDLYASTPREFAALARVTTTRSLEERKPLLICSGPPVPETVFRAFQKRFGAPVLSCYQSAEAGPVSIDLSGQYPESVGTPFAGVDVQLKNLAVGKESPEAPGAILVKSNSVASHYLPAISGRDAAPLPGRIASDGWLRTGDRGFIAADGRLTLADREDDLVRVDRRRVALGEVESCLERMDSVRAAQAHVEYDDSGSAKIVVAVTPGARCRPGALIDHCAKHLAPYKVPSRIDITK